MSYFLYKIKVVLDLFNYAAKSDLKMQQVFVYRTFLKKMIQLT